MPDWRYQTGFRAGEVANSFLGSFDSEVYSQSARTLENCVVTRRGSAKKRGGTRYVAGTTSNRQARLFFWRVRTATRQSDVVIVVEGDGSNGAILVYDADSEALLATDAAGGNKDYSDDDLAGLTFVALPDRCIILHEDHGPLEIVASDLSASVWPNGTFPARDHSLPRLLNRATTITMERVSSTKLTFSAPIIDDTTSSTDPWIFTLDQGLFITTAFTSRTELAVTEKRAATTAGPKTDWQGPWVDETTTLTVELNYAAGAVGTTQTVTVVSGAFTFTGKEGSALVYETLDHWFIVAKITSSTVAECIRIFGTGADDNTTHTLKDYDAGFLTLDRLSHPWLVLEDADVTTAGTTNMYASLADTFHADTVNSYLYYNGAEYQISAFVDDQNVSVTNRSDNVTQTSWSPASSWAISPNKYHGYPRTGAVHQNRLFYGGFKKDPGLLVSSAVNDHWDFTAGSDDDDPLSLRIFDDSSSGIQWMHSTDDDLIVGTGEQEIRLAGNPLTPTNLGFNRQSFHGGAPIVPAQLGIGVIFSDEAKQMLRETTFVEQKQRYEAVEINTIASHLFTPTLQIKELHLVKSPEQGIYVVRSDGESMFLSRNTQQAINAWTTWPVEDLYVESATTAFGTASDKVWMVVKRTIGGSTKRYIEIWEPGEPSIDSRKKYTSPASTTLTGLDHLEGETVRVDVDGGDMGSYTVSGNQITDVTQADTGTDVQVGVGFNMNTVPHPMIGQDRMGFTAARGERVGGVHILVSSSLGGTINTRPIIKPSGSSVVADTVWDKHSGWVTHFGNLPDVTHRFPEFTIVHAETSSFEILAVGALYEDTAEV